MLQAISRTPAYGLRRAPRPMDKIEHKSFFRTHKVLSLFPLVALGAAVFWYISRYKTEEYAGREPVELTFGNSAPAAQPAVIAEQEEARALSALDIQGPPEFKSQVTGALKLIWMADRETFLFIRNQLYIIRNEDKTDFYLDAGQPVAAISNAHAFRSMPWCAGIIAHQAFHSYAKARGVKKNTFRPPSPGTEKVLKVEANPMSVKYTSLEAMLDGERKASEFQVKVLRATGASRAEVKRAEKRGPRDFTTGHDGYYSNNP